MGNLFSYLKNNNLKSFEELPFNEIDSLILCQLSYLNFELFDELKDYSFRKVSDYVKSANELSEGTLYESKNRDLLKAISKTHRFKDLLIGNFNGNNDYKKQMSYASMTFHISDIYYYAFRGTDTSVLSWKEDFNMALYEVIPSHVRGLNYVNDAIEHYQGDFILGGHSKGGNISIYVGYKLSLEAKKRLICIYDYDSPGFKEDIFSSNDFLLISDKVKRFIPVDDVIGLLLYRYDNFSIVKSDSLGIFQHNLFSWEISDNNTFVLTPKATFLSSMMDRSLCLWLNNLTISQRRDFLMVLFKIFDDAGITDFNQFKVQKIRTIHKLIGSLNCLSKSDKSNFFGVINQLLKYYLRFIFFPGKHINENDYIEENQ